MMPSCDQIGVPIHFHSSTTSGSASLMSLRTLLRVSPRQSPSSAILFEMSSDADWPWLAPDFFMFSPFHFGGGSENRTPRPWAAPEQIFDPGACGTFLHRWPPKHAYFCTDGVQPSDAQVRNLT